MVEGILIVTSFILGLVIGYVFKGDFKVTKNINQKYTQEVVYTSQTKDDEYTEEEKEILESVYDTVDNFMGDIDG